MTTQIEHANELLRAALDIFEDAQRGPYVKALGECETLAHGGGDGICVAEEIKEYFDLHRVPRKPQMPALDE